MSTAPQTRSLYRSFLRELGRLNPDRASLANLRRLYRPQLRDALLDKRRKPKDVQETVDRTLSLLRSSPSLAHNLSSLAYHHTPYPLPHTSNAARLAHLPRAISWNAQDPAEAGKAWERREKAEAKDSVVGLARGVDEGLRRFWRDAEREGGGVMLGRITKRRYGDD
ncbi:hypothetical protein JCM8097_003396 [Rhodosporidiobolus ruineniae]